MGIPFPLASGSDSLSGAGMTRTKLENTSLSAHIIPYYIESGKRRKIISPEYLPLVIWFLILYNIVRKELSYEN